MSGRAIKVDALESATGLVELYRRGNYAFKWALLSNETAYSLNAGKEAIIACLKSPCSIRGNTWRVSLSPKDLLYLTGPASLVLEGRGSLIVIGEAPSRKSRVRLVKKFSELSRFTSGLEGYRRDIYVAIGEADPSDRLMAGFTEGWPGEWTSFPPHKHDDKLEIYVYYGLNGGYGLQVVEDYDGVDVFKVRDYDAVIILRGYHPNVATPNSRICYLWILCQVEGRKSMKVEFQPGFERIPLGTTHLSR
ncbi:MAG: hypothetical protein DRK00_02250 [Thermoprotei archaeon]|nr:MAG: hypothetical protein DRK00_02250 [Thermoprotei archaeon]